VREEHLHVADDELLLHADGEVRSSSSARIQAHLESCPQCRARLKDLANALLEFGEAQRTNWNAEFSNGAEPRALLELRLAELTEQESENGWLHSAGSAIVEHRWAAVFASVGVAAFLLLGVWLRGPAERSPSMSASLGHWEEPDLRLTPGATVPVSESDLCRAAAKTAVPVVPISLARKVFEEYGVTQPRPDAYEVDYLITPELGGATDIRNLWPEPYQDTVWNAHVKDQLEDRLHRMVCHGDLDLATAQRDISTDWIAAYRKYFHADQPVVDNSSTSLSSFRRSAPST
jgi:anti-sigma factor RsiW